MAIRQTDDNHAKMHQVRDDRKKRGFLPTMLGGSRGERTTNLAVQCATHPQTTGLIEERGHLRRHASITGAGTPDDRIVVLEIGDRCNRSRLVRLEMRAFGDL